jgi:hypothetical protein
MAVKVIRLNGPVRSAAEQGEAWKGKPLTEKNIDVLVTEDADVIKPNGEILLQFRKNIIAQEVCSRAYKALRVVGGDPSNRPTAALGRSESARYPDGTLSKQTRIRISKYPELKGVGSGLIGFMNRDRTGTRFPYCRKTAFSLNHPELFAECMDYIRLVDQHFKSVNPARHSAQLDVVKRTEPSFVIHGTAFTTITVNKNFRTLAHQDAGDLKQGFGVMSVVQGGKYSGGYTVFPEFRVAVDMRTSDVLLADVHEWHGNTPIVGITPKYERIACVFYYREKIQECETPEKELERAKTIVGPRPIKKGLELAAFDDSEKVVTFPIFVPSKGRPNAALFSQLEASGLPYTAVVEPQEEGAYRRQHPNATLLILPQGNRGITFVRQFILEHARHQKLKRYWQIDDNIRQFLRVNEEGKQDKIPASVALRGIENQVRGIHGRVALAAADYVQFACFAAKKKPYSLNNRAYCCVLTDTHTDINYRNETETKEDVDFTVQHLTAGWQTLLSHRFAMAKPKMGANVAGGLSNAYKSGRHLVAAKCVHALWPKVSKLVTKPGGMDVRINWQSFRSSNS